MATFCGTVACRTVEQTGGRVVVFLSHRLGVERYAEQPATTGEAVHRLHTLLAHGGTSRVCRWIYLGFLIGHSRHDGRGGDIWHDDGIPAIGGASAASGGGAEPLHRVVHSFGNFSGAGKSTLLRLVLGLLTPDKGRITLYSGSQEVTASPLTRSNIVYVPQGNTLLNGTIRSNLLLGNPSATEVQLKEVLHTAVAEFVFALPNGLDTRCGEDGVGLSEGQAQCLAIARGLLRPGGVLLLDEPTSSLDGETERTLLARLVARTEGNHPAGYAP